MENIYNLVLDLKQSIKHTEIVIPQLDNNTHKFNMKVTQNGNDYVFEDDITSELAILKTDGNFVVLPTQKTGSTYIATLTEQALTTSGITKAELRFKKSDELLTSTQFSFLVREVIVSNKRIESTSVYKALDALLAKSEELTKKIDEGIKSLSNVDALKAELSEINAQIISAKNELTQNVTVANEKVEELKTATANANTAVENFNKEKPNIENLNALVNSASALNNSLRDLNASITEGKQTKTDLDGSIANAKDTKAGLEESTATANSTKTALDNSTKTANAANTSLTNSINGSETAKENLDTSIGKANTAKTGLDDSIGKGSTLKQGIESDIATAATLKSDISKAVTNADTKKTELNTQIQQAETTNTSLSNTDTNAKSTKTDLEKLLQDLNLTKGQVQEIIASGNLDQYVTDVKLQNELKAYATKEDLQSIDVTSQLGGYAKKTEVPTKLSQLTNDTTFKTETEIQSMINAHTPDLTGYVEKVQGKGLSTNDYTNTDKAKVDNIPTSPKYTDTITTINGKTGAITKADITALGIPAQDSVYDDRAIKSDIGKRAYKTEIPTKLSQLAENSTHRTVTDTEKSTWNNKITSADVAKAKVEWEQQSVELKVVIHDISAALYNKQDRMTKESVKALGFPEHVVLTQTQYNALSSTQKADSTVFYYIKK